MKALDLYLDWFKSEEEPRQGPLLALTEALLLVALSLLLGRWGLSLGGWSLRGFGAAQHDAAGGLHDSAAAAPVFQYGMLAGGGLVAFAALGAVVGALWAAAIAVRWIRGDRINASSR